MQAPTRTRSGPPALIVPIGPVEQAHIDYLGQVLPESFAQEFRVFGHVATLDAHYDPLRRQWNAMRLLEDLAALGRREEAPRVLGVTSFDLFIPILTFVFGLAHLEAGAALVSLHRLAPEFYGLAPDPDRLLQRLEKEVFHELGHTHGLRHCRDPQCVMHYSNTVEEVDLKEARYCADCALSLPGLTN